MITWAEIRPIIVRVLRWWWLVILAVSVAGGTAYYLSANETRYYVARVSMRVGNTLENPIPDQNQLSIGWSLARYYGELARREPILKPVQEELQLPFQWQLISDRMLTTNVVPTANLLEVYVTDTNPDRAALIANAIAKELIAFSPNAPEKVQAEQQAIEQQLRLSEQKSQDIQAKINDLLTQQQSATSASDLAEINQKLALLQANLEQEKSSYTSLLNYKNTSIINSLDIFEPATPPREALPSKRKMMVAFGGLAGLMLSFAAIYVLDRLDRRVRSGDMKDTYNIQDLGSVPIGPPIVLANEEFAMRRLHATREVQTNILLAGSDRTTQVLLITSPEPSEVRSSFSIDLASLFGRAGHRVLIVDADFATSFVTRMLTPPDGSSNEVGSAPYDHLQDLWAHLRPTVLANVALLPGRSDGNGLPVLIPSLRWKELVASMSDAADVIIFDGPSALSGPDAALLAPHVDGVVLTLDPRTDRNEDVLKSQTRLLHQKDTRLLGAVTFTDSEQRAWKGALFGQLRGGKGRPELPAPGVSSDTNGKPPIDNTTWVHTIITPIVDDSPASHEAHQTDKTTVHEFNSDEAIIVDIVDGPIITPLVEPVPAPDSRENESKAVGVPADEPKAQATEPKSANPRSNTAKAPASKRQTSSRATGNTRPGTANTAEQTSTAPKRRKRKTSTTDEE